MFRGDVNGRFRVLDQPTETGSWIQRFVIRGRRRELGLGAASVVSLAEARKLAFANRELARSGGNPLSEKRRLRVPARGARRVERRALQRRLAVIRPEPQCSATSDLELVAVSTVALTRTVTLRLPSLC